MPTLNDLSTKEVLDFVREQEPKLNKLSDDDLITGLVDYEQGYSLIPALMQDYNRIKFPSERINPVVATTGKAAIGTAQGVLDLARQGVTALDTGSWKTTALAPLNLVPEKYRTVFQAARSKAQEFLSGKQQELQDISEGISGGGFVANEAQKLSRVIAGSSPSYAAAVVGGLPSAAYVGGYQSYLSSKQETLDNLTAQGVPIEEATKTAEKVGLWSGVGTSALTVLGGKFGNIERFFANVGAGNITQQGFKAALRGYFKGIGVEGVEEGLDNMWSKIVSLYNTDKERLYSWQGVKDVLGDGWQGFKYGALSAGLMEAAPVVQSTTAKTTPPKIPYQGEPPPAISDVELQRRVQAGLAASMGIPAQRRIAGLLGQGSPNIQAGLGEVSIDRARAEAEALASPGLLVGGGEVSIGSLPTTSAAINAQNEALRGRATTEVVLGTQPSTTPPGAITAPGTTLSAEDLAAAQQALNEAFSTFLPEEDERLIQTIEAQRQAQIPVQGTEQAPAQPVEAAVPPSAPAAERGGLVAPEPAPAAPQPTETGVEMSDEERAIRQSLAAFDKPFHPEWIQTNPAGFMAEERTRLARKRELLQELERLPRTLDDLRTWTRGQVEQAHRNGKITDALFYDYAKEWNKTPRFGNLMPEGPLPPEQVQAEQPVAQAVEASQQPSTKPARVKKPTQAQAPALTPEQQQEVDALKQAQADLLAEISRLAPRADQADVAPRMNELGDQLVAAQARMDEITSGKAVTPTPVSRRSPPGIAGALAQQIMRQNRAAAQPAIEAEQEALREETKLKQERSRLLERFDELAARSGAEETPEETEISQRLDEIINRLMELKQRQTPPPIPAEGSQGVGITPQAANVEAARSAYNSAAEFLRPNYPTDPRQTPTVENSPLPAVAPQSELKSEVTRPGGAGKIWVFGRFFDARYHGNEPVKAAFIIHAWIRKLGNSLGVLNGARFKWADKAFTFDKDGKVTNVPNEQFLSDLAEKWYADPTSVELNAEQQRALNESRQVFERMLDLMVSEGIPRAKALQTLLEENETKGTPIAYFARTWVGKVKSGKLAKGRGASALAPRPPSLRERSFPSEQAGFEAGHRYAPSVSERIATYVERAYTAIAAHRLITDPSLGGRTIEQRVEDAADRVFPELAAIKATVWSASTEAQKKARYARYREVFEDLQEDFKEQFTEIRSDVAVPRHGEGRVMHPSFIEYFYDKDTAAKINERISGSPHKVADFLTSVTKLSNSLRLALDNSAPFVQGLPMFWWSVANRKNVWGRAVAQNVRTWFDPGYMERIMSNPRYAEAAQQFVQLGGGLGRLYDYMAGAQKGEFATKVPFVGKAFERAGAAFGAFLDMGKLEWWMAVRDSAPQTEWRQLAEGIENLTGQARMEETGMHPSVAQAERLAWLAASYYRSGANVVANLFERGATGKVTRQAVGSMFAGTLLTAVAGMIAAGLSPDEIERKVQYLDLTVPVELPNGRRMNVGFSNIILSLAKLGLRTGLYYSDDIPISEKIGGGVERNPILRFLWGHAGPIPAAFTEGILGRDFLGQNTNWGKTLAKLGVPLSASQIIETRENKDTIDSVGDALPTLIGLNAYPEPYRQTWFRTANEEGRKQFGKSYDQLSIFQQSQVVREINKNEFVRNKPAPTRKQIEAMAIADERRRKRVEEALSPDNRKILENYGMHSRGYDVKLKINGHDIYLSQDQQKTIEALIVEEYNRIIERIKDRLGKVPIERRQELLDDALTSARERARGRFIALERSKSKSP